MLPLPSLVEKSRRGQQRRTRKVDEVYDLCGVPLPPGARTKPVGPDRIVYHRVPLKNRSESVPAGTTGSSGAQRRKDHRMQGLTKNWYGTTIDSENPVGPSLTAFQRAAQLERESMYTHLGGSGPNKSDGAGEAAAVSSGKGFALSRDDWHDVPRCVDVASSVGESPSKHGPTAHYNHSPAAYYSTGTLIVRPNVFGTTDLHSPEELARREQIRQHNIQSTRRLRAGIPEPIPNVEIAREAAFRKEIDRIQSVSRMSSGASGTAPTPGGGQPSLMQSASFAHVAIEKSYPFERQLQGRTRRDAQHMEKEMERCLSQLSVADLQRVIPRHRQLSMARDASIARESEA